MRSNFLKEYFHYEGAHLSEEEIRLAEDKFEESFNLASMGMFNLLENDIEQISQLASLAESLYDYHNQCAAILQSATERLNEQRNEAASRPKETYQPKKLHELNIPSLHDDISPQVEYGASPARSPAGTPVDPPPHKSLFLGGLTAGSGQTSATSPGRSPNRSPNASPLPSPVRSPARTPVIQQPCAQALSFPSQLRSSFGAIAINDAGFLKATLLELRCQ
ncbi:endophilin-A [Trichonephila clavata]|uniref:Endophilin-A n=1 Tax=Trichonephila clavata TaxID=2740835 RepID=A0A8X6KJN6_TRICU|nr:endophilin-A [Trichonephila clavata]